MAHLYKRGHTCYLKYYIGGKQKELSLRTRVLQIAKEKQRQFESGQARGVATNGSNRSRSWSLRSS